MKCRYMLLDYTSVTKVRQFPIIFLLEEFKDTKGVIRTRESKDRQHNDQKKKDKQRSTRHTLKTKDRVTRTDLQIKDELRCSGMVSSSCSTSGTRRVNLVTNPEKSHDFGTFLTVWYFCFAFYYINVRIFSKQPLFYYRYFIVFT